jgi:hypothetical protein
MTALLVVESQLMMGGNVPVAKRGAVAFVTPIPAATNALKLVTNAAYTRSINHEYE